MADTGKTRRRGGGRAGAANRRGTAAIEQMPWRIPVNTDRPTEPLGPEGVQAIHDGAMRILEDIGIEFLNVAGLIGGDDSDKAVISIFEGDVTPPAE